MEATAPGLPFMSGAGGGIEDCFDTGLSEVLMHGERVGMETFLGSAGSDPQEFHFLIEGGGVPKCSLRGSVRDENITGRTAHGSDPSE